MKLLENVLMALQSHLSHDLMLLAWNLNKCVILGPRQWLLMLLTNHYKA